MSASFEVNWNSPCLPIKHGYQRFPQSWNYQEMIEFSKFEACFKPLGTILQNN
jgi:hypothetical protein